MAHTRTLRIAHVCKSYSPTSQTFIHDYVTELHARPELDCHVVAFKRVNVETRPFDNVHVATPLARHTPRGLAARVRDRVEPTWHGESRPRALAMHEAIRATSPDVVHAHFGPSGALALDACDAPLVVSHHGFDVSELLLQPIWRERYARLWEQAAAVTVVSNLQRGVLTEAGCPAEKIHVVRVGKRMDELTFTAPARPVRHLICVGRFTEKKAQLDTVRAVDRARQAGAEVTLDFIGGGELRGEVARYVEEHDLGGCVALLGELPFTEVVARMRAADAFILTSKTARNGDQEGVPTVLMEAQALGLPCLSTWHAGIPEVIPEQNHWALAEEGDVEGIAERIARLAALEVDALIDLTRRGRAKVEAEFDLAAQVERLAAIYQQITS